MFISTPMKWRCGECQACKNVKEGQRLYTPNPPFTHATDETVLAWNKLLIENPCSNPKVRERPNKIEVRLIQSNPQASQVVERFLDEHGWYSRRQDENTILVELDTALTDDDGDAIERNYMPGPEPTVSDLLKCLAEDLTTIPF